jgi:polyisoprenoid-binding protein YceI
MRLPLLFNLLIKFITTNLFKTMKKLFFTPLAIGLLLLSSCEKNEVMLTSTATGTTIRANDNSAKQLYALNAETSVAEWKGHSPSVSHYGSFAVESQDIQVVNGKIKSGTFTIPIASIKNFDLPDEVKPVLLEHLKSPDFFNLVLYPAATFTFRKVTPLNKPTAGAVVGANYQVTGDFTLLGKSHTITFPAKIKFTQNDLAVEASLKLDRTQWGMTYAADPALGEHHIYPEVDIYLQLSGQKQ